MEEVEVRSDIQAEGNGKRKDDEETTLDGEFIKVEKEPLDVKDEHGADRTSVVDDTRHSASSDGVSSTVTTTEHLSEAREKIQELESVLERVSGALEVSKSENYRLENEVIHTKKTIEESLKKYEEMEIIHSKLKNEIIEAEERSTFQINSLQHTLQTHEAELKEFAGIKEAFDSTTVELEKAKNSVKSLEQDLSFSASEARKFEEMHGKSLSNSELQNQRILELESLLNEANTTFKSLEDRIDSLQIELREKVAENEKVEEEYSKASVSLATIQEELQQSQSLLHEAEKQIVVNKTFVSELGNELSIREASESRLEEEIASLKILLTTSKEDLSAKLSELEETKLILQEETKSRWLVEEKVKFQETNFSLLQAEFDKAVKEKDEMTVTISDLDDSLKRLHTSSKEDFLGKVSELEETKLRLQNETRERELVEENFKFQSDQFSQIQNEFNKALKEKEELEATISGLDNSLLLIKGSCSDLESKLTFLEGNLSDKDLLLSQTLSNKEEEKKAFVAEVAGLTNNLLQVKGLLSDVETKLKLAEETFLEKETLLSHTLSDLRKEKGVLEAEVVDLTSNISQKSDVLYNLRKELKLSEEKHSEARALLSEALLDKTELGNKLTLLEEMHKESETTTVEKILQLEEKFTDLNVVVAETKSQLQDSNAHFAESQQDNKELREQLSFLEVNSKEKESEILELSQKLSGALSSTEEVREELNLRVRDYENNLSQLELNAAKLSSRNLELGAELEELEHSSYSKQAELSKRAEEMQLLIVEEKERIQKLEEQLQIQGLEFQEAEASSVKLHENVSQLTANIEALEEKIACLDKALEISFSSEKDLKESLDVGKSEKVILEEDLNVSNAKLAELERFLELLQSELLTSREKLFGVEDELRVTGTRESEAVGKLKLLIEQSEKKEQIIEESTLKIRQLETLVSDFELKLQEVSLSLGGKESEVRLLTEKLKENENQTDILVTRNSEAEAAHVKELGEISLKVGFLEKMKEEISNQLSETDIRASQFALDNELLVETNSQLKGKIVELQGILDTTVFEKAGALKEVDSHINTISELKDQSNVISELLSVSEARLKEAETHVEALNERFSQKNGEVRELGETLSTLRSQLQAHEKHVQEDDEKVETWRLELESTTIRLKDLEHFVKEVQSAAEESEKQRTLMSENNLKLTQEVSVWELKYKDITTMFDLVVSEKHQTDEQLRASENEVKNLTRRLASEIEKLQSQLSSLVEENNSIKKEYEDSKNEGRDLKYQLEEQIRGQKGIEDTFQTKIVNLEAQVVEKSSEITHMKELEAELVLEKDRMKLEVENISAVVTSRETELSLKIEDHTQKERERESQIELVGKLQAELNRAHICQKEEEEKKKKQVSVLEEHVKELEHKLQTTTTVSRKKGGGGEGSGTDKKVMVKQNKSGEEGGDAPTSLKFVIGVAFVSAVMGVILGKQY